MTDSNLNKLNFQPHSLTQAEIDNPEMYLGSFFDDFPIHLIRENLWSLFRSWLSLCGEYADETDIRVMLLFYEQFTHAMELSYVKGIKDGYIDPSINSEPPP
jgi:hypothetical protein